MLYAKFMHPNNGREYDKERTKNAGLIVGERYEVEDISMSGFSTSIFLKNISGGFNSVQFDFYEDKQLIDIYSNPKYSGYCYT